MPKPGFYDDGHGCFGKTLSRGIGFHEAQVTDLNGDGLPNVLEKPYNWQTPRVDVWLQMRGPCSIVAEAHGSAGVILRLGQFWAGRQPSQRSGT